MSKSLPEPRLFSHETEKIELGLEEAVVGSALWAAWGDAIGFVTELAKGPADVKRRSGVDFVSQPVPWSRRIGGRFGPVVELPPGTYSDDTQLRLAVTRCVRSTGRFDVETFSKIELPVSLNYGLGMGRGTREAAKALNKRGVRWLTNFGSGGPVGYVSSGGNGAAMRIQPHVWAARDLARPDRLLGDVLANAICTHGHVRGVLGAAFHALVLAHTLRHRELPEPGRWRGMARYLVRIAELPDKDDALRDRWLPMWEQASARSWSSAVEEGVAELHDLVVAAVAAIRSGERTSFVEAYRDLLARTGGIRPETRGAGTVSAVLALSAAWHSQDEPSTTIAQVANVLGSDTDTIASMAGALVGAVTSEHPPGELLDRDYLEATARRCVAIGRGEPVEDFPHPDLVHWKSPGTLSDMVGLGPEGISVAGLGPATELAPPIFTDRDSGGWQWLSLRMGQTLLVRRRERLRELDVSVLPQPRPVRDSVSYEANRSDEPVSVRISDAPSEEEAAPMDLDAALTLLKERDFEPAVIGTVVLLLAEEENGLERLSLLLGSLVEAYRSRRSPRRQ